MSKRLVAAYVLDVVAILAFGLISYGFNKATPHYHPFSLLDLSISYPLLGDTVTNATLILSTIMAPAIIIALVCLLAVPRPAVVRQMPTSNLWRRKIWELFVGWMGLALSFTTQLLLVQGLKNVIGKPRPDMLARCLPDLTNIAAHTVGGYGQPISDRWVLVSQTICTQTNKDALNDGFKSFPSGHSATSFAGLLYLTLFLCTKFSISFPLLPSSAHPILPSMPKATSNKNGLPYFTQLRDEAASAPVWLLFLVYIPVGGALYISGSRYFDYHHHGFDVISGALIGILTSYVAYRWYHVPISFGAGWAFAPRSPDRAFGIGVGNHGYVDSYTTSSSGSGSASASAGLLSSSLRRGQEQSGSDDVEMGVGPGVGASAMNGGVAGGGGAAGRKVQGHGGGALVQSGYESLVGSSGEEGSRG